jgi:hypothetical protein
MNDTQTLFQRADAEEKMSREPDYIVIKSRLIAWPKAKNRRRTPPP